MRSESLSCPVDTELRSIPSWGLSVHCGLWALCRPVAQGALGTFGSSDVHFPSVPSRTSQFLWCCLSVCFSLKEKRVGKHSECCVDCNKERGFKLEFVSEEMWRVWNGKAFLHLPVETNLFFCAVLHENESLRKWQKLITSGSTRLVRLAFSFVFESSWPHMTVPLHTITAVNV